MVTPLTLQRNGQAVDSLGLEVDRTLAVFPHLWGEAREVALAVDEDGVLGPSGAAAAYRRSALEDVGLFDERIFIYYEDVELALRLRAAGWRCAVAPKAICVHLGSATLGTQPSLQLYLRSWSRGYILRKYGVLRDPGNAIRVALGDGATVLWQLVARRETAGLRGRMAGWRASRRSAQAPQDAIDPSITLREGIRRRRRYRG
jgi:N-acetylglucosaminyl-diphospho-decaprenol L-rhamnosyltransferase